MTGKLDKVKGKIKEKTGDLTNNEELKAKGKADQAKGKAKETAADLKDKTDDLGDNIKK
ncbi:CsbD family protein [Loigolactobacillus iwatensis]|uniref:CsbD family protein n=1 Tax=Loigolactobacillus iwatensis TaxID=1267156 RepID=UPI000F7E1A4E|nr:CsbD family protein [Loigolactobacillus iwatensis]